MSAPECSRFRCALAAAVAALSGLSACSASKSLASPDAGAGAPPDGGSPIAPLVVDDQSSSLGEISLPDGGYWYTFPLGANVTPTPNTSFYFTAVDGGTFSSAACFGGTDVGGFGAGAGFAYQLDAPDGGFVAFDGRPYTRITFYAMSPDTAQMNVGFADTQTFTGWPGAACAGGSDAGPIPDGGYPQPPCGDTAQAAIPLAPSWQKVDLSFSRIQGYNLAGYYVPKDVDPSGLLFTTFDVTNPTFRVDGGTLTFHVCVAQIELAP
jgi:hypothetical protein